MLGRISVRLQGLYIFMEESPYGRAQNRMYGPVKG